MLSIVKIRILIMFLPCLLEVCSAEKMAKKGQKEYVQVNIRNSDSTISAEANFSTSTNYQYFDEYLLNLNKGKHYELTLLASSVLNRRHGRRRQQQHHARHHQQANSQTPNISPKAACCLLGKISGDQGYHCNAKFYQRRIEMRNANRAQTRRAALWRVRHAPRAAADLLLTFGKCVRKHSKAFHACCYAARLIRASPDARALWRKKRRGKSNAR